MKNLTEIVKSLDQHDMFVKIDPIFFKKLKSQRKLKGYRRDGTGSRLMCYVNLARIAKKLKKDFVFYWDLRSDKYSDAWPHNRIASKKIDLNYFKIENIKYFNSLNEKISEPSLTEWKFILLKGEKKASVIKECSSLMKKIFSYQYKTYNIKNNYEYGLHVRCGGLNATTGRLTHITKIHFYKDAFNLGKWYPKEIWVETLKKINKRKTIIVSDDYKYIKRELSPKNNIVINSYKANKTFEEIDLFIYDILVISQANKIICSVKSGAGLIIMLLSKNSFYTPEKFLNIENIYFSFSEILYKYFIKFNTLKNLLQHNKNYFFSKPIEKYFKLKNKFKRNL